MARLFFLGDAIMFCELYNGISVTDYYKEKHSFMNHKFISTAKRDYIKENYPDGLIIWNKKCITIVEN